MQAVNVPVSIAGMDVAPGEIVHMDENGACKFPAIHLESVLANVRALLAEEEERIQSMRAASTLEDVLKAFGRK